MNDSTLPPLYKFLSAGMVAPAGKGSYTFNRWRSVSGELVPCRNGLHATTADNLMPFISETLWRVEIGDEYLWHDDESMGRKLVARRMRVVDQVETWNERTARLFAADCAERVLPLFEANRPEDSRPRQAIEIARRFANGTTTRDEMTVAGAAAWAAAGAAAWDAAWAAARAAAWAAAWAAARAAAGAAARAAAWAAAGDAERSWQNAHLARMLGLEVAS